MRGRYFKGIVWLMLVLAQGLFGIPAAYALSTGCTAINALSGSSSLSLASNIYAASQFVTGDTLTVTFTDSGADYGGSAFGTYDLFNMMNADETVTVSSYGAYESTSSTSHTVTQTYSADLATQGIALYLDTSQGEISNIQFSCTGTSTSASTVATLSALSISSGTLTPTFASGTTSYSDSVDSTVSSVTLTPKTTDSGATVTVNGALTTSGSASGAITLGAAGQTSSVPVVVTAADGVTTTTYTVSVYRKNPPVASDQSAKVTENSSSNTIALSISGGTPTAVTKSVDASHGTATISGTTLTYTPTSGYTGTDSVSYAATNSDGSSSGTVTITITAATATLTASPATNSTLTESTAGTAYSQTVAGSGGTSPYTYSATGLPAGLTIGNSTGVISGTATATGTHHVSVLITDATNAQYTASYTITVSGAVPTAINHTVTLYAGQTVNVSLTDGASGGPFTGATLTDAPSASQGTASIKGNAGAYSLVFTAAAQASGSVLLRYTLSNASGTSSAATVALQINARPDPTKDAQVVGMVTAETQSAEAFANAQIQNFNDRLEQLHDPRARSDRTFNVHFSTPQSPTPPPGASANADGGFYRVSSVNGAAQQAGSATTRSGTPVWSDEDPDRRWLGTDDLAFWSGGFVDFGGSTRNTIQLSHTLVGLSAGADYTLTPALTAGLGVGYGRDVQDVGTEGTQTRGNAFSTALYASYHPGPVFVDGMLGYTYLDFDSHRYVTETGAYADGSRAGDQVFGSLSSGYEFRGEQLLVSPYARVQFSSTLLRHFTESGAGAYDLSYANQRVNMLSAVGGMRGKYSIPTPWGAIQLSGRFEFSHALTGNSLARIGYADVGDNTYSLTVLGLSENTVSVSSGIDLLLPHGMTTGLSYQGTYSVSDHAHDNALLLKLSVRF